MAKYGCNLLKCVCCCCVIRQRFIVSSLCLWGIVITYSQRVVLSIAVTKMVSTTIRQFINECLAGNETVSEDMGPTVDWSEDIQQYVLSSFFAGYLAGHVPSGLFSDRLGPRLVFFWGMVLSTAGTLATPFTVQYTHWVVVIVIRVLTGLAQSVLYPCVSILLARYVPPQERGVMGAFSMAASSLGLLFGNFITGQITNGVKDWRWAFHFFTILGGVWCLLFFLYVFDESSTNPRMLDDEKQFLAEYIPQSQKFKIPWKGIMTDKGIYALMIGSFGSDFWIYLMLTNIPKYMGTVLHLDMNSLSMATSFPSILLWLSSVGCGSVVDWTITKKHTNVKWNRRVTSLIGVVLPLCFTVAIGYVGCDITWAIILYSISNVTRGPYYCSLKVNHLDLTHNFAGIVMALINGFGCFAGIGAPLIVKAMAGDNTLIEWRNVFWTICSINLACHMVYFFLAQADRAKWDIAPTAVEGKD